MTQAIHLPTLARLTDRFRVVAVMDTDAEIARDAAGRAGAKATTSVADLLADPAVDVVAICSPHQFHAEQVEAVCAAGKRGILCEKPLAVSRPQLDKIASAATTTGTPIVVGAMHTYDPGWLAAVEECGPRFTEVHTVRSTIVLPFNARFEDWATEVHRAAAAPTGTQTEPSARVRDLVLGLMVHDLPLVRVILPDVGRVDHASFVPPFGGTLALSGARGHCDLLAFMRPVWQPDWRLEAVADDWSCTVSFTPSYVHAGSATVEIRSASGVRRVGPWPSNGYEAEWVELHAVVAGGATPRYALDGVLADMAFAMGVADDAVEQAHQKVA